jgi:hypothetical protein
VTDPFDLTGETVFLVHPGESVVAKVVNYSGERPPRETHGPIAALTELFFPQASPETPSS